MQAQPIATKACKKCGETKPLTAFYRAGKNSDGHRGSCKECTAVAVAAWRAANPDHRARERRDPEKQREHRRRWNRNHPERNPRWREKNPEKRKAHDAVRKALKSGRLVRPDTCEGCGATGRLHAHHDDYEKRLDVRWLCPSCHVRVHAELEVTHAT